MYLLFIIIRFSAHPQGLEVTSRPKGKYSDQYTLRLSVVSLPQITEFELIVNQVSIKKRHIYLKNTIYILFFNLQYKGVFIYSGRGPEEKYGDLPQNGLLPRIILFAVCNISVNKKICLNKKKVFPEGWGLQKGIPDNISCEKRRG